MDIAGQLGLQADPFGRAGARAQILAPAPLFRARDQILSLAAAGTPVVFAAGAAGTGKTVLLGLIAETAAERGQSVARVDRGSLAHTAIGSPVDLLLVDEAHSITDATLAALLDEGSRPQARTIVLAALQPFPHRLREMADFATVELKPLDAAAARAVLVDRAADAGRSDLFTPEALDRLVEAARGSPRRLRILTGASLFHAAYDGATQVSAAHAAEALRAQPDSLNAEADTHVAMPAVALADRPAANDVAPPFIGSGRRRRGSAAFLSLVASAAVVALVGPMLMSGDIVPGGSGPTAGGQSAALPSRPLPLLGSVSRNLIAPAVAAPLPGGMLLRAGTEMTQSSPRFLAPMRLTTGAGIAVGPVVLATAGVAQRPIVTAARLALPVEHLRGEPRAPLDPGFATDIIEAVRLPSPLLLATASTVSLARPIPAAMARSEPVTRQASAVEIADRAGPMPVTSGAEAAEMARAAAAMAAQAAEQARTAAEEAKLARGTAEAASVGRTAAEQSRAAQEIASAARAIAEQAQAARDSTAEARAAKDAAEQAKAAKDMAAQATAAREAAEQAKSTREAAGQIKAAVAETHAVKEALDLAKAAKDAAEQAAAAKEAAGQARAAKEAAEQAKAAKDAAEQAKAAKEAADQAHAAKEAAAQAKAVKEAVEQAKAVKDAADQAKAIKEAVDQSKLAKEAAEQAKAVKDAAKEARGVTGG